MRTCLKLNGIRKNGVEVDHAYSNICFDLLLVLHKAFLSRSANSAKEYVNDVRELYSLSNEADIKSREVMMKILAQITLDDVKTAIFNAEGIRKNKTEDSKIIINDTDYYYHDPDFSINIFLKKVLEKSGIDMQI